VSPSVVFNTVNQPLIRPPAAAIPWDSTLPDSAGQHHLHASTERGRVVLARQRTHVARPSCPRAVHPALWQDHDAPDLRKDLPWWRVHDSRIRHPVRVSARPRFRGWFTGGNKSLVANMEYYVDIGQIRLLAFYDAGEVRDVGQSFALKEPIIVIVPPSSRKS